MTKWKDIEKPHLAFIVAFIVIVSIVACIFVVGSLFPHPTEYKKGIIRVVFMPDVTDENITLIIESYGCTISEWYGNRSIKINGTWQTGTEVYVNVPAGKEKEYVTLFKENDSVYNAYLVWAKA